MSDSWDRRVAGRILALALARAWPAERLLARCPWGWWQLPKTVAARHGLLRLLAARGETATALLLLSARWRLICSASWIAGGILLAFRGAWMVPALLLLVVGGVAFLCCCIRSYEAWRSTVRVQGLVSRQRS